MTCYLVIHFICQLVRITLPLYLHSNLKMTEGFRLLLIETWRFSFPKQYHFYIIFCKFLKSAIKDISVFQYKLYLKECFYIRLYTYIKKSIFGFILLFFPKEKYICTFHRRWVRLMVIKMPLHVSDNGNGNRWKSWPYSFFLSSF